MAQAKGGFGALFSKGSVFEQILIWQVLGQVLSSLLGPENQLLTNAANSITQAVPLSPAVLADLVVRTIITEDQGATVARKSGISPDDFHRLVLDAGEPPPTQMLLEAYRRGYIAWAGEGGDLPSATTGLLQGRLRNEWIPLIARMATVPIPVADAVDAVVEGQIEYAQGEEIAYQNGIAREDFRVLFNTRGNPPDPTQLAEMVHRGVIPLHGTGADVLSFDQGISESAWKNKWIPAFEAIMEAIPPPRTVTALERAGSITHDQAITLYMRSGLSQDLAAAYSADATHQKLAADKQLAKSDVLQLYADRVISAEVATQMLDPLGYNAVEAKWLLTLQDVRREISMLRSAISRIGSLYVARKIDKPAASAALDSLKVPSDQRDQQLTDWDVERQATVKTLTAAEIVAAFHYKLMDQSTAIGELVGIGYTPYDGWVLLSIREHEALPDMPAPGAVV